MPNCSARASLAAAVLGQAQVDHVQGVQREVLEVLVDLGREVRGRQRGPPAAVRAAPRAHLGHDAQTGRVGVQGLPDELVDHHRPVEVAGVDVGDAQLDGFAQHVQGLVTVPGRPEDARPGQLHGAVAHAAEGQVVREREGPAGHTVRHVRSFLGIECISNVAVAV